MDEDDGDGDEESGGGNNDDLMTTIHFVFNVDIQAVGRCQQQGWHDEDGYGDGDFDDDNLSVHNLDIQAVGEGCCQQQGCTRSRVEKVYHEVLCQEFSKPRCSMNV